MAPSSNKTAANRAIIVLLALLVLGFGSCIIYLGYVQLAKGDEYRAKAEQNQLLDTEISAARGIIYDRNMKELAKSASAWKVIIYPSKLTDENVREQLIKDLSAVLVTKDKNGKYTQKNYNDTEKSVRSKAEMTNYNYLVVQGRIEKDLRDKVLELMKKEVRSGEDTTTYSRYIDIEDDVKRYYPYGTFASTVIGFTGADEVGRAGLELSYNSELTGINGRTISAVNGGYGNDAMPSEYETKYDPQQGMSLVTTLDETIQRYLEESLSQAIKDTDAKSAYGIVMDVKTGAVLGMSSKPDYDSNDPFTITDTRMTEELKTIAKEAERDEKELEAQYSQWRNRTISDTYEPGSVFKVVTAAAALEENLWPLDKTYTCIGSITVEDRIINCAHTEGHGTQDFSTALANSCNPFFINLGLTMGKETFFKYFEAFGLTDDTGIDLPAEASPVEDVTYHGLANMGTVELASSSFGQSFQVSPIQMLSAISAVANGGKLMQPYIVSRILNEKGEAVKQISPKVKRQVVSESTCNTLKSMMSQVVNSGTGINGYVAGYRVAGKTGTSEKLGIDEKKYVASFVCFAPSDDPKVAVLVAIDEPVGEYYGSQIAAPLGAEVMQKIMTYLNVEPKYTEEEQQYVGITATNVTGRETNEARSVLEDEGFNVRVVGYGEKVLEQSPSSNQPITKGGTIILYTEKVTEKEKATVPNMVGYGVDYIYQLANYSGINVKIVGSILNNEGFVSYRQSKEAGTEVNYGDTITVYFKSASTDID